MYYHTGTWTAKVEELRVWYVQKVTPISYAEKRDGDGEDDAECHNDVRQFYKRMVQDAWDTYRAGSQQRVFERLTRIRNRCDRFVAADATVDAEHRTPPQALDSFCNEIADELIDACAVLAQPAYHLGNITGQTDYFHMWLQLWRDIVDSYDGVLPERIAEHLPLLYNEWPQDSILKRAFMRAISGS